MSEKAILSAEERRQFRQRGFLVRRGFYDADTIGRASAWCDALADADPELGKAAKYYEPSVLDPGEDVLVRVENIMTDDHARMRNFILTPQLLRLLEELMGAPAVLFKDKVNYKGPGCRADKLHQDQAAGWSSYADYFVSVLIAVDRNTKISKPKENAPLSVMCSGNFPRRGLMTAVGELISECDPPYQPEAEYFVFEAEPGDVLLFDSYVPHGSGPNTSTLPRRNFYLTFNLEPDGDHRKRYYEAKWRSYPPNRPGEMRTKGSYRV